MKKIAKNAKKPVTNVKRPKKGVVDNKSKNGSNIRHATKRRPIAKRKTI